MPATSLAASYSYCQRLSRRAAKNFYFSFLTLPADRFRAMCALYAFMRITDDIGDAPDQTLEQRRHDLHNWLADFTAALNGAIPQHPALPAIVDMVRRYSIPPEFLFDAIAGVEQDLDLVRIENFHELENYCYHVAGTVGLCCIHIWGFWNEEAVPLALDCGLAFQLTNILRDVAEDWSLGRIYLPAEDLRRFGYTTEDLAAHCYDARFRDLLRFEADRARSCYQRSERLMHYLEEPGKPILRAMLDIYGGLLHEIVRRDFNVFQRRIALPKWKKVWYATRAVVWR